MYHDIDSMIEPAFVAGPARAFYCTTVTDTMAAVGAPKPKVVSYILWHPILVGVGGGGGTWPWIPTED